MSALPPEFEETEVGDNRRPGRSAALQSVLLVALFLLVAAAVIAGILLTWAAIQPVLPAPAPTSTAALAGSWFLPAAAIPARVRLLQSA